ncbi:MAG: LPS export ABC transporter periplasmic protein LptC [Treponema sp.]|jgi:LPS export ABC transporter protein LptC|nr:LPS export ABC transporter periplasmic protein LptC [Treponema sp.]
MKKTFCFYSALFLLIAGACSFDYGETMSSERELPDLIMENVEYVRVRSADPVARFQAERAERYEKQRMMKLQNFSFEQYGERGEAVNTSGMAGNANMNIDSGDIFMSNGVRLEVESEDIIIETRRLDWKDDERILSTGADGEVHIYREDGTNFTGTGLRANARRRIWEFSGSVSGAYIYEEDEDSEEDTE